MIKCEFKSVFHASGGAKKFFDLGSSKKKIRTGAVCKSVSCLEFF